MNIVDLISKYFSVQKVSNREYSSECPWCGGTDRLRIWPYDDKEGGKYWCRKCNRKGGTIKFSMDFQKLNYKEACGQLGIETNDIFQNKTPTGSSTGSTTVNRSIWLESAKNLVTETNRRLIGDLSLLDWLKNERGLNLQSVQRFQLGWNDNTFYCDGSVWGFGNTDRASEKKAGKIVIPGGLVIPRINEDRIIGITIRRANEYKGSRYGMIRGSTVSPMVIGVISDDRPVMVLESDLDAILVAQEAGDLISVVSLGTAAMKPRSEMERTLKRSPLILVSLDWDDTGNEASTWWLKHFPTSMLWPVPTAKDPCDAMKKGIEILTWVLAGIRK